MRKTVEEYLEGCGCRVERPSADPVSIFSTFPMMLGSSDTELPNAKILLSRNQRLIAPDLSMTSAVILRYETRQVGEVRLRCGIKGDDSCAITVRNELRHVM